MIFSTHIEDIYASMYKIDALSYSKNRNFINGAVTMLSPYISRGVISTKIVYDYLKKCNIPWTHCEKLIQELAWRDYWQQVWLAKQDLIDTDLKQAQMPVHNHQIPKAIINTNTGIIEIDKAINNLYKTGYMHNHTRMYVASIACNIGLSHWFMPAKWLYYHLLDGDWASNSLSWQWIAGSNSNKKYFANQANINTHLFSKQKGTFLDVSYEDFKQIKVPKALLDTDLPNLTTTLPNKTKLSIDNKIPTLVYNYYNLDPYWRKNQTANRVLLFSPKFFQKYPVSELCINFVLDLAKNISNIQIFVGEIEELYLEYSIENIIYKNHPTNRGYKGLEDNRDWLSNSNGYNPSFFNFWKKCKKQIEF